MDKDSHQFPRAAPPPERGRVRRLGELLRERCLITGAQLDAALKHQKEAGSGKQLGQILIEAGLVTSEDVARALSDLVKVPFIVLTPDAVETESLGCLPAEFLKRHNLLPLSLADDLLTIAVEQFTDIFLIEDIARRANRQVLPVAATADNIRTVRNEVLQAVAPVVQRFDDTPGDGLHSILEQIGVDDLKVVEHEQVDEEDLVAHATNSPVVKLVNYVIKKAVELRASDIHIEPGSDAFRVRYRIDGELVETVRPNSRLLPAVVSRIKIMAGMDISERRMPQDGSVTVTLAERPIDLRVSTMPTRSGEKAVLRLVDREAAVRGLNTLGLEPVMLADLRAILQEPTGIVLVTGPTGSGKTTTLYGALAEIVSNKLNVSTIEDPVERVLPGTNQFQVQPEAGFTFAGALRSMLRQDPDVIMVGEIRDAETAKLATEAALTGHMVLSTLHTNDAPTAVPRLVNMGVEPYLIAASLRGVVAQRLVRQLCPHCRTVAAIGASERQTLAQASSVQPALEAAHIGVGCLRCRETGYIGRVGVFELLVLNEEILSSITHDPTTHSVRHAAQRHGFTTLVQDGFEKVRRGTIGVSGLLEIMSRMDFLPATPTLPSRVAA